MVNTITSLVISIFYFLFSIFYFMSFTVTISCVVNSILFIHYIKHLSNYLTNCLPSFFTDVFEYCVLEIWIALQELISICFVI